MDKCSLRFDAGTSSNFLTGKDSMGSAAFRTYGFGFGAENCLDLPLLAEVRFEDTFSDFPGSELSNQSSDGFVGFVPISGRKVFGVLLGTKVRFFSDRLFAGVNVKALMGKSSIIFENVRILDKDTDLLVGGEIVSGVHLPLTNSAGVDLGIGVHILSSERGYDDFGYGAHLGFLFDV